MAWRLALGLACSLDQIPRTLHMARCGLRLTETQTECKFSVQHSVSEIDIAGSIARIAQKIAEVGNSGGADESHFHIHAQRPGAADAPMSGDPLTQITECSSRSSSSLNSRFRRIGPWMRGRVTFASGIVDSSIVRSPSITL